LGERKGVSPVKNSIQHPLLSGWQQSNQGSPEKWWL